MDGIWDGDEHTEQVSALRVRFPIFDDVEDVDSDGDGVDLKAVRRVFAEEIADLESRAGVDRVRVEESDVGVGASGYAFEVIVEGASFALNALENIDTLATAGGYVLWLIEKVRRRRKDQAPPTVSDSTTLGAVAAARLAPLMDLTGRYLVGSQRMNGQQLAPDETDERNVWASAFQDDDRGDLLVVFLSSDCVVLGQVLVPIRLWFGGAEGYEVRSGTEARRLFHEWNGIGGAAPA